MCEMGSPLRRSQVTKSDKKSTIYKAKRTIQIVWRNAVMFLVIHLLGVYGLLLAFVRGKFLTIIWGVLMAIASGLGITVGAHRLYTHRSFKATWPVRLLLVAMHTLAGQNSLYIWVRDHRQHHKYSDTDADPHNARRGFFFSHIGWLMVRKHPEVIAKGKTIDMSDLEADPMVMFQKKFYIPLYLLLSMGLPVAIPCLLWKEEPIISFLACYLARTVAVLNITWLVNSAAHIYGTRPYNRAIFPVENNFVSMFTLGEGWHNYHHTFPSDYRAAEFGRRRDLSTRFIDMLAKRGWVYGLNATPQQLVNTWAQKYGDGNKESRPNEMSYSVMK